WRTPRRLAHFGSRRQSHLSRPPRNASAAPSRVAANRCLASIPPKAYSTEMSESEKLELDRARRVELARKAFKEYFALCFWSSNPNMGIHEEQIPFIIRGLRHYGGHRG